MEVGYLAVQVGELMATVKLFEEDLPPCQLCIF